MMSVYIVSLALCVVLNFLSEYNTFTCNTRAGSSIGTSDYIVLQVIMEVKLFKVTL